MKAKYIVVFIFVALMAASAQAAVVYYIDATGGSDSNNGLSPSSPWKTINKINKTSFFLPGDSILLKRGESWNETLTVLVGGTAGASITLSSYGAGAKPIINGGAAAAIQARAANRGYWTIDGLDLRSSGAFDNGASWAIYHNWWASNGVELPIPGWIVQNCSFNAGVMLFGPNTIVRNNVFDGTGNTSAAIRGAIMIRGEVSSGAVVELNTISNFANRGVWIMNAAHDPIVRYNLIHDIKLGNSDGWGSGIDFDGYGSPVKRPNCYGNTVYNCAGPGIWLENALDHPRVYGNLVHDCETGIALMNYATNRNLAMNGEVLNNIIYHVRFGVTIHDTNTWTFANNTITDGTGSYPKGFSVMSSSTYVALTWVNNIIGTGMSSAMSVPDNANIWKQLDYNNAIPVSGQIMERRAEGKYLTLADLRALGLETHSLTIDPGFVDAANHDFHLKSASPCINAGATVSAVTYDYDNNPRPSGTAYDIGAFEYQAGSILRPQIVLSKKSLSFGATTGGAMTSSQQVIVSNSAGGTFQWTASPNAPWIDVGPSTGTGTKTISIICDPAGLTEGDYSGSIAVIDANATNSPQTIAVALKVIRAGFTGRAFGEFATPTNWSTGITGAIPVTGWALDDIETVRVEIKRNPVPGDPPEALGSDGLIYIGEGIFVEGARPDVEQAYPAYPLNERAGWGYLMLTNVLPNGGNGTFTLSALATDKEGNAVLLGTKMITCSNAAAVKPFGTIDSPAHGGDVSGNPYLSFGWVLTPLPKTIPKDGSTIDVYVDGVKAGNLASAPNSYNRYRVDVATAFSGLNNSSGPAGVFYLDTTKYESGMHTISWIATDDQGASEGIGSRYFNIVSTGSADQAGSVSMNQENADMYESANEIPLSFELRKIRRGFNLKAEPDVLQPDNYGIFHIEIQEVERIEINLGKAETLKGYQVVGQELRSLPIGSTLHSTNETYSWMPGPGFIGTYELLFLKTDGFGATKRIQVKVTIRPKFEQPDY